MVLVRNTTIMNTSELSNKAVIGLLVRDQRKLARLTQGEVAKRLGVSRVTYIEIEQGKRELSANEVVILGGIFGVSLWEIFQRSEHVPYSTLVPENTNNPYKLDVGQFSNMLLSGLEAFGRDEEVIRTKSADFNEKKMIEICLYVMSRMMGAYSFGVESLQVVLYLADTGYSQWYGRPLFGGTYKKIWKSVEMTELDLRKLADRKVILAIRNEPFSGSRKKYLPLRKWDRKAWGANDFEDEKEYVDNLLNQVNSYGRKHLTSLLEMVPEWRDAKDGELLRPAHQQ